MSDEILFFSKPNPLFYKQYDLDKTIIQYVVVYFELHTYTKREYVYKSTDNNLRTYLGTNINEKVNPKS